MRIYYCDAFWPRTENAESFQILHLLLLQWVEDQELFAGEWKGEGVARCDCYKWKLRREGGRGSGSGGGCKHVSELVY